MEALQAKIVSELLIWGCRCLGCEFGSVAVRRRMCA